MGGRMWCVHRRHGLVSLGLERGGVWSWVKAARSRPMLLAIIVRLMVLSGCPVAQEIGLVCGMLS